MRVLHLVPRTFLDRKFLYLGSTKDIASRVQYFDDRSLRYDLVGHWNSADAVIQSLTAIKIGNYSHILIEKGNHSSVFQHVRKEAPRCKIFYRAHNAEIPHRLDYVRAYLRPVCRHGTSSLYGLLKNIGVYGSRDITAAHRADQVFSICEWDTENYWHYLAGKRKAATVPFFLTRDYLTAIRQRHRKGKTRLCVVLGSTRPGPLIENELNQFFRLLQHNDLQRFQNTGWRFVVTGVGTQGTPSDRSFRELGVRRRNFDSPYEMLGRARAALFLSDYGRGFKTKILEAIMCGAFVICPAGLYRRLPQEVKPYGIVVDPSSPESLVNALDRTIDGLPDGRPNAVLQAQAYRALDQHFGVA